MTEASAEGFFLCFGPPKSGTTFLQRMLDLHPQVSCPSEHQLDALSSGLDALLDDYSDILVKIDQRTGGQGSRLPDRSARLAILRAVILELSRAAARGKPVHGLSDNALFFSIGMVERLFGRPKMIAIVRNPVDLAVSTWRHNVRLAREELEHAGDHLAIISNPAGLDGFVLQRAGWYNAAMQEFLGHVRGRPNITIVLYERLVGDKRAELQRLCDFLGVDRSDRLLDPIIAGSSPEAMASGSSHPEFYGVASSAEGSLTLSDGVRQQVLRTCWPVLEQLGYRRSDLAAQSAAG